MLSSQDIYEQYGQEMFFYILKKVKDKSISSDILQSSFLKIHKNIHQIKDETKARAWAFQIGRNEIANHFNTEMAHSNPLDSEIAHEVMAISEEICCFDRFIDDLPNDYREVIMLSYISGKKQEEVAEILGLSLANVKARIRRSKALLKKRFQECCKFEANMDGKLVGTPNCTVCS